MVEENEMAYLIGENIYRYIYILNKGNTVPKEKRNIWLMRYILYEGKRKNL